MSDTQNAWGKVGDEFTTLGSKFKDHYRESIEGDAAEAKKGIDALMESMERAFDSVGKAVKDPEVRDDAKRAGSAFVDAIGRTFTELGETISAKIEASRADEVQPRADSAHTKATDAIDSAESVMDRIQRTADDTTDEVPGQGT